MNFLLSLLTLLLVAGPLQAQTETNLSRAVRSKLAAKTSPARIPPEAELAFEDLLFQTEEETAEQKALNQLAKRQNPKNWKYISWQDFLKQNEHAKGVELVSTHLDWKCMENFCAFLPGPIPQELMQEEGNSEVDYKAVLAEQKLIFVAEGMNHDTKAAPLEVTKILRAVRETNPQAKILLAAEFLTWDNHESLPVLPSLQPYLDAITQLEYALRHNSRDLSARQKQEIQEFIKQYKELAEYANELQESIKQTPLLKKAGTKSKLNTSDKYAAVFQTADELGIDQLALDDIIPGFEDKNVAAKVGEFVIWSTPKDKIPSWEANNKNDASYRFYALQGTISVSPWGVRERNREWARRIQVLLPLYDVVIIYAGSGHLGNTYYMDLQPMLKQDNFMNITLYPLEELPPEVAAAYARRANATERHHITQDSKIWAEIQKASENIENKLFDASNYTASDWLDKHKPFWVITQEEEINLYMEKNWSQEQLEPLIQETQRQAQSFPFKNSDIDLTVYLPAE